MEFLSSVTKEIKLLKNFLKNAFIILQQKSGIECCSTDYGEYQLGQLMLRYWYDAYAPFNYGRVSLRIDKIDNYYDGCEKTNFMLISYVPQDQLKFYFNIRSYFWNPKYSFQLYLLGLLNRPLSRYLYPSILAPKRNVDRYFKAIIYLMRKQNPKYYETYEEMLLQII